MERPDCPQPVFLNYREDTGACQIGASHPTAPCPVLCPQPAFHFGQDFPFQVMAQIAAVAEARFCLGHKVRIRHRMEIGLYIVRGDTQAGTGQDGRGGPVRHEQAAALADDGFRQAQDGDTGFGQTQGRQDGQLSRPLEFRVPRGIR